MIITTFIRTFFGITLFLAVVGLLMLGFRTVLEQFPSRLSAFVSVLAIAAVFTALLQMGRQVRD